MTVKPRLQWTVLILLLLIGFGLRIYHLDNQNFWTDEHATWDFVRFWPNPIMLEARMWVYLGFVAPWSALINTEMGVRWPSVMASMLSIALIYAVGKRLGSQRTGLIAALLLIFSPMQIYYSQEARSFALVVMFALLMLWTALLSERDLRWASVIYAVSAIIATGLHMVAGLWVLTLNTFLIFRKWRIQRGPSLISLMFAPVAIAILIYAIRAVGAAGFFGWGEGLEWISIYSPFGALTEFSATAINFEWPVARLLTTLVWIPVLWRGWLLLKHTDLRSSTWQGEWSYLLLITLVVVPPALIIAVTYVLQPLFALRYLQPSLVSMMLLLSLALTSIKFTRLQWLGVAVIIAMGLFQFTTLYRSRPEWRDMMIYVAKEMGTNDIAIVCQGWQARTAEYYFPNDSKHVITYEAAFVDANASDVSDNFDTIYFIDAGCPINDIPDAETLKRSEPVLVDDFNLLKLLIYRKKT